MPRSPNTAAKAPNPTSIEAYRERGKHPIVAYIDEQMPNLVPMLPRSTNAERFKASLLQALINNPDVLTATPQSIIRAVIQATQEGIAITGAPGGAYLVNFGGEAQLLRDYRALTRMAVRSGAARKIEAHVVREGDTFAYHLGTDPRIEHTPLIGSDGDIHTVYAVATLPDGSTLVEVMTKAQVEHVRAKSRAARGKPWTEDWPQMARKTAIRRLVNYLALSPEERSLLDAEERAEFGELLAPVARVSRVDHGALAERAGQRAARLTGNEPAPDPSGEAPTGAAVAPAAVPGPGPASIGGAPGEATLPVEATTIEEATGAVWIAAGKRGLLREFDLESEDGAAAAWNRLDEIAHDAIPDTPPADLAVADWLAIRDRIEAGEFDPAVARPGR
jgi:recombination protein RecT